MTTDAERRSCQSCQASFTIDPEDFAFYTKMQVPAPTWCPTCRLQRRLTWRNERVFFKGTCQRCSKTVITVYPPESGITVYCRPCWWGDEWEGLDYGMDFDPSRPFLSQLKELMSKVPFPDLFAVYNTLENSDYVNMATGLKNCYYMTMSDTSEDCAYCSDTYGSKDSYESLMLDKSELCYETVNCRQCYQVRFSIDCLNSRNVSFSRNCVGSSDLIGCVNLRGKQYCIFNQQYTKEEYERLAKDFEPTSRAKIVELRERATAFWQQFPNRFIHEHQSEYVSGDYIANCKNVRDSYMVQEMENARYCMLVVPGGTNDAYDHTHYGSSTQQIYETLQVGNGASNIRFCWFVLSGVADIEYSLFQIGGSNNFGCVGLKKKQYCILNKQYTKEEYERLRDEIMKQMNEMPYVDKLGRAYPYGNFFPSEFSPFPYNATAQTLLPLSKDEVLAKGFAWRDPEPSSAPVQVRAIDLPERIENLTSAQSLLGQVLECTHQGTCDDHCSGAFTIIAQELAFYSEQGLPLPNLCPNCRHFARIRQRNSLQIHQRTCQCAGSHASNGVYVNVSADHDAHAADQACPNTFQTTYAPDRPEIVYCDACYLKEVV